jgi:hypothetical protein
MVSRGNERVQTILKAAVAAGSTATLGALYDYEVAVSGFLSSLKGHSVFDTILPSCVQLPLHVRIALTTTALTATRTNELAAKPIKRLSLANKTLEPVKAVAQVVITKELAKLSEASNLIASELRNAVSVVTDKEFFNIVLTGITPIAASGTDAAAARKDLAAALSALVTGADSKIFFVVTSALAKQLSLLAGTGGALTFPNMSPEGGTISGVPTLVSDGLAAGTIVALDASQIAAGSETLQLRTSTQAIVAMDDAPAASPDANTTMVSLWQTDEVATLLERYFGAERLRDSAVAVVNGAAYAA